MFLILKLFLRIAYNTFVSTKDVDPRMVNYPLVTTPWPGLAIVAAYLLFVLKFGPEFMKNRKPYDLKILISLYNACLVIANAIIVSWGIYGVTMSKNFSLMCQPIDYTIVDSQTQYVLKATYFFYLTKFGDLFDSVFFVLRKKFNQLSFLHIYHHTFMVTGCYVFTRYYAGSHVSATGILNSFIHTVMYSYYFLTSYNPEIRKQIWWKKYLTIFQLIQFGIGFIHYALPLMQPDCKVPTTICFIGLTQTASMIAMFSDFYFKTYIRPKKIKEKVQ